MLRTHNRGSSSVIGWLPVHRGRTPSLYRVSTNPEYTPNGHTYLRRIDYGKGRNVGGGTEQFTPSVYSRRLKKDACNELTVNTMQTFVLLGSDT
jgi:hypothetical protein